MTREELRVLLNGSFCGCGAPDAACATILRLLRLHPLHSHRPEFEAWISDDGIEMLLLGVLDRLGLTEHGGSIGGGWLS